MSDNTDTFIQQNPGSLSEESEQSWLPAVSANLKSAPLDVLHNDKALCGTCIYTARYFAEACDDTSNQMEPVVSSLLLLPLVSKQGETFDYEHADLDTTLTIFSFKSSLKLQEHYLKQLGYSYSQAALVAVPVIIVFWTYHGFQGNGLPLYVSLGIPKLYLSASLGLTYKALAQQIQRYCSRPVGYLLAGSAGLVAGLVIDQGRLIHWLPAADGFTQSLAGKSAKLSGYGLSDALCYLVPVEFSPLFASLFEHLLLYGTLRAVDSAYQKKPGGFILTNLRRGMIVKSALSQNDFRINLVAHSVELVANFLKVYFSRPHSEPIDDYERQPFEPPENQADCIWIAAGSGGTDMMKAGDSCPLFLAVPLADPE